MNTVVLDTSVIVAGLISSRGASSSLVDAIFRNQITIAYTAAILSEYAEVLDRPVFADVITPADRAAVVVKLRTSGILVKPAAVPSAKWPDIDDLPFVAAALATEGKIIVTLNPPDFVPAAACGIRILSPSAARRELL